MSDARTAIARVLAEHPAGPDFLWCGDEMTNSVHWECPDGQEKQALALYSAHVAAVLFDTIVKPLEDRAIVFGKKAKDFETEFLVADNLITKLAARLRLLEDGITALADKWDTSVDGECLCFPYTGPGDVSCRCGTSRDLRALLGGGPHE